MEIRILHLYYDMMNLYGEYGNIKILEKHLQDQGFEVIVDKKTINEELIFDNYDYIYIGCGTEKNLQFVMQHLVIYRDKLKEYIENEKIILATGNSFEMFGKNIDDKEALGIFDYSVRRLKDRKTTDVIYTSDILENEVVGFINKMGEVVNNEHHLFEVVYGVGENKDSNYEGVYYKNFFGTYISGPILVRNPEFLKLLIMKLCNKKGVEYKEIKYDIEQKAYELVLGELKNRK